MPLTLHTRDACIIAGAKVKIESSECTHSELEELDGRGVATGVDIGIYTPQISQNKLFYGVKMTSVRLFNSFIHPKKTFIPPKTNSGYAPARWPLQQDALAQHASQND